MENDLLHQPTLEELNERVTSLRTAYERVKDEPVVCQRLLSNLRSSRALLLSSSTQDVLTSSAVAVAVSKDLQGKKLSIGEDDVFECLEKMERVVQACLDGISSRKRRYREHTAKLRQELLSCRDKVGLEGADEDLENSTSEVMEERIVEQVTQSVGQLKVQLQQVVRDQDQIQQQLLKQAVQARALAAAGTPQGSADTPSPAESILDLPPSVPPPMGDIDNLLVAARAPPLTNKTCTAQLNKMYESMMVENENGQRPAQEKSRHGTRAQAQVDPDAGPSTSSKEGKTVPSRRSNRHVSGLKVKHGERRTLEVQKPGQEKQKAVAKTSEAASGRTKKWQPEKLPTLGGVSTPLVPDNTEVQRGLGGDYDQCIFCGQWATKHSKLVVCDRVLANGSMCPNAVCYLCLGVEEPPEGDFFCCGYCKANHNPPEDFDRSKAAFDGQEEPVQEGQEDEGQLAEVQQGNGHAEDVPQVSPAPGVEYFNGLAALGHMIPPDFTSDIDSDNDSDIMWVQDVPAPGSARPSGIQDERRGHEDPSPETGDDDYEMGEVGDRILEAV